MRTPARTWERGDAPLNLLVLGVVLHGYTVPLVWTALDHDGNSGTVRRIQLVSRLLKALPAGRWKGLVADREFIGGEWFRFLRRKGIKRAIRIRKNAVVDELRVDAWFGDLKVGEVRCLAERANVYGEVMQVVATRSPAGDLVAIATDFSVWDTCVLYRARWSVESTFASLKVRGFDPYAHGHHPPGSTEDRLRSCEASECGEASPPRICMLVIQANCGARLMVRRLTRPATPPQNRPCRRVSFR